MNLILLTVLLAADWTEPVHVFHDDNAPLLAMAWMAGPSSVWLTPRNT